MKHAVEQIRQLIQYHENERDKSIEFLRTDRYAENTVGEVSVVIEHTERIYAELIDELQRVILMIEEANESDEDPVRERQLERIRRWQTGRRP